MQSAAAQNVLFTKYAQSCVRFKARQLSRRSEFRRCDEDDLRQELWLLLLREAHRFDPRRASLNTFVDRVLQTAAGMIVRGRIGRSGYWTKKPSRSTESKWSPVTAANRWRISFPARICLAAPASLDVTKPRATMIPRLSASPSAPCLTTCAMRVGR